MKSQSKHSLPNFREPYFAEQCVLLKSTINWVKLIADWTADDLHTALSHPESRALKMYPTGHSPWISLALSCCNQRSLKLKKISKSFKKAFFKKCDLRTDFRAINTCWFKAFKGLEIWPCFVVIHHRWSLTGDTWPLCTGFVINLLFHETTLYTSRFYHIPDQEKKEEEEEEGGCQRRNLCYSGKNDYKQLLLDTLVEKTTNFDCWYELACAFKLWP